MKYLKVLGLAAVVAAALMAFVGAGTASAETTLCKEASLTNCYGVGTVVEGHSINTPEFTNGKAILTTKNIFGINLECHSTISGKIETATTPSGQVEKKNLTWTECAGGSAETVQGGEIVIHHEAGTANNGTVTLKKFVVKAVQAGVACYYSSEGVTGTFVAGTAPKIEITAEPGVLRTTEFPSGSLCPSTAGWHATYELTKPTPAYVVTGE